MRAWRARASTGWSRGQELPSVIQESSAKARGDDRENAGG